ncbi:MAG: hypothetical protein QNJ90_08920 [Planctomycetota bacterium]|nr:hypothetical protein [Planctomycetota bacterium]
MLPRRRLHRRTFLVAGIYNLVWGLWTGLDPQWLFRFADMPELNHPQVFACLGMVIGVYGLLYLEVARRPEHGFAIAAIGMSGKLLGPAGWLIAVLTGAWPIETGLLILTNDVIWWVPFGLYLRDAWPAWRATWNQPAA